MYVNFYISMGSLTAEVIQLDYEVIEACKSDGLALQTTCLHGLLTISQGYLGPERHHKQSESCMLWQGISL
jgi:hypothetical protein